MTRDEQYQAMYGVLESIAANQPCPRGCKCGDDCCLIRHIFCTHCMAQQTLNMIDTGFSAYGGT